MGMSEGAIDLPQAFAEFVEPGLSIRIGTRDAHRRPECAIGWGAVLHAPATLTVYLPHAFAGRTIQNLEENGQIAVALMRLSDYHAYQVKGCAAEWRVVEERERPPLELHAAAYADAAGEIGQAIRRVAFWPAVAIDVEVRAVFLQTPGPGTGQRLRP
jgi:hypothetical protein